MMLALPRHQRTGAMGLTSQGCLRSTSAPPCTFQLSKEIVSGCCRAVMGVGIFAEKGWVGGKRG